MDFNLVENLNWQSMQKLAPIAADCLYEYPGKCLVVLSVIVYAAESNEAGSMNVSA